MTFTIDKKLWSMTLLMLILLTILGVTSYKRVMLINSTLGNIVDNEIIQNEASKAMEIQVNRIAIGIFGYLLNEDSEHLERIENGTNDFLKFYEKYHDLCTTDKARELGIKVKNEFDRLVSLSTDLVNAKKQQTAMVKRLNDNDNDENKEMTNTATVISLRRSIQSILSNDIQKLTARDLEAASDNSRKAVKNTLMFVIGLTFMGFIIGGLGSYFISRSISIPLERLSKWADNVAARDFSIMEIKTSNDEIGHLNDCFKKMITDLKEFNDQNMDAVQNINSTSAEIFAAIQQQSSSIKEQAAAIQETSSTMEEIRETGSQVSERAKEVARMAEATSSASEMGISAVEDTHAIMESIRGQVEEVARNIVTLSEKTQVIGDIIATVNDIAEQSNLLALNAAIEAVGAGTHGERFSVVANEMKILADQAKESTIEVRTILGEIQGGISTSVMSTEEAVKRVETGRSKSEIAARTIKQLTDTTTESITAFQQIVAGTGQQQIGLDQVSQALKDIEQGTEQTASGIGQIEIAVADLNELSIKLKTIVKSD